MFVLTVPCPSCGTKPVVCLSSEDGLRHAYRCVECNEVWLEINENELVKPLSLGDEEAVKSFGWAKSRGRYSTVDDVKASGIDGSYVRHTDWKPKTGVELRFELDEEKRLVREIGVAPDIRIAMLRGFGNELLLALRELASARNNDPSIANNEMLRAIVFLSENKLSNFRVLIELALQNPDEVRVRAEYDSAGVRRLDLSKKLEIR